MFNKMSRYIFNIIYLLVFLICIFFTYNHLNLLKEKSVVFAKQKEETEVVNKKEERDLNYFRNYYSNDDIIGTIKIQDTNINNLIVKSDDNKYYLNHSIEKEYDERGSIFLDYRTDFDSKQLNIYGHNSNAYKLPFKDLENYLDKDYYKQHKYIEIWNGDKKIIYEIFSVQIVTDDYEHINVSPNNLQTHINKLNKSIYDTGLKATIDDQILVLQTCLYNPRNSLIIVISKRV